MLHLDRGPHGNDLVGVYPPGRRFSEERLHLGLYLGHSGHASYKEHFVHVARFPDTQIICLICKKKCRKRFNKTTNKKNKTVPTVKKTKKRIKNKLKSCWERQHDVQPPQSRRSFFCPKKKEKVETQKTAHSPRLETKKTWKTHPSSVTSLPHGAFLHKKKKKKRDRPYSRQNTATNQPDSKTATGAKTYRGCYNTCAT